MSDVSARVVRSTLDMAHAAGVPRKKILEGFPFDEKLLKKDSVRVPWPAYVTLLKRLREEVGDLDALEDLGARVPEVSPELRSIAAVFVTPKHLVRFAATSFVPAQFANLRFELNDDGDQLRIRVHVPPPHEDSPELARIFKGGLRSMPRYLGAPDAKVRAEFQPRQFTFWVKVPASKTLLSRFARARSAFVASGAMHELSRSWQEVATAWRANNDYHAFRAVERQRIDAMAKLGHALAATADPAQRAECIADTLKTFKGCTKVVLAQGERVIVERGTATKESRELKRELAVAGKHVGSLTVFADERVEELMMVMDRIVPWASMGLAAGVDVAKASPATDGVEMDARVARAVKQWDLTERQQQVLALLVKGRSNKEIAAALQCAERTVEIHVTHLLRKSDAGSRAMITAKFWTEL
ncbi:MAG: LuxR C-terminal-related transcriptional regulator [Myxococcaceae bacterium]